MAPPLRYTHTRCSAVLTVMLCAMTPNVGHTDDAIGPVDLVLSDELKLLKEEESVTVESEGGRPLSPRPSDLYVRMMEEDIGKSGMADLPSLLRQLLGFDAPQTPASDPDRRPPLDNRLITNRVLVLVDGRSMSIDTSDAPGWNAIPVTLHEIARLEVWKEPAPTVHGGIDYHVVIKIMTKTGGK